MWASVVGLFGQGRNRWNRCYLLDSLQVTEVVRDLGFEVEDDPSFVIGRLSQDTYRSIHLAVRVEAQCVEAGRGGRLD